MGHDEGDFIGTPEEEARRRRIISDQGVKEWVCKLEDKGELQENGDGSYDAQGDVDVSPVVGEGKLLIRLNKVEGNFVCKNGLDTLEGFPKEVHGNLELTTDMTEFSEEDVREICNVRGKLTVKRYP